MERRRSRSKSSKNEACGVILRFTLPFVGVPLWHNPLRHPPPNLPIAVRRMGGFRICTDSTHLHFAESISIVTPIPRCRAFRRPSDNRLRPDQRLERER